jgi:hypothetical protein
VNEDDAAPLSTRFLTWTASVLFIVLCWALVWKGAKAVFEWAAME